MASSGDRFKVLSELGRGAMGAVFRAKDKHTGEEVALKLLHTLEEQRMRRFRREAEIATGLDHPGIVSVLAVGTQGSRPFIAYELVPQANELDVVFRHAELLRRVELIRDAARALGYAHSLGIVHRDVKPANLLVDLAGQVRVADFGLAHHAELERMTQSGAVVGTPSYMAPEQVRGDRSALGAPTDVWALGVILYEGLTGESPFLHSSLTELMASILSGTISPPRAEHPDVPPALERICLRALQIAPEDRYPDANALAEALEEALGELYAKAPLARERGWIWPAAFVAALALISAGWISLQRTKDAASESPSSARPDAPPEEREPKPSPTRTGDTRPPEPDQAPAPPPEASPPPSQRADAEAGDPRAMGELGAWLIRQPRRQHEGVSWLRRAAEGGDLEARVNLGVAYEKGLGVTADVDRALDLYREAADKGSALGAYCLGNCLALRREEPEQAIGWFERAAEGGERRAFQSLFALNLTARKDRAKANVWLRRGAEAGDPTCMVNWGIALYRGLGVEVDRTAAVTWYARAAESGSAFGMSCWAETLVLGEEVPEDLPAAVLLYTKALEAGYGKCFFKLSRLLLYGGPGLEPDHTAAARWGREAERKGWTGADFTLGVLSLKGWGVAKAPEAGQRRLELAISRGSALAMHELGKALWSGEELERDQVTGRALVERAAAKGLREASETLEGWSRTQ